MGKRWLARLILRGWRVRLATHSHPFNRLMGQAVLLQLGKITDVRFRQDLEEFYSLLDRQKFQADIDYEAKAARLRIPGGYKADILGLTCDRSGALRPSRWDLWARRFGLLHHLGIRSDILILRQGEQVPPHGHYGVVSGFYVLEGEVAIRHFDRMKEAEAGVLVRKVLDLTLTPGGSTTNSEYHHNIHWVYGLAPESLLFRVSVTGSPTPTFGGAGRQGSRVYVDPTGQPDASGLVFAPYVSAEIAHAIPFPPSRGSTFGKQPPWEVSLGLTGSPLIEQHDGP